MENILYALGSVRALYKYHTFYENGIFVQLICAHISMHYTKFEAKKGEKIHDDERATTTIDNNIKASARNLKHNEKKKTHTLKQNKRKANRHFIW